ncbi:unnamed protein product [Pocillopora meandrina]|uniref:G-protein coupled receptors family 1 profile domain-containing protein n=1 Tax=Pocillopora meandrina TaxID=46732 RepID=A0AAU9WYU0_9CNID|nr:unnamed protein product [Pocillopora meandrina]
MYPLSNKGNLMVMEFESTHVVITTVLLLLVDIDIADNILVCLIIKRNLQTRITINYLPVNLAFSNILFATFITPKVIVSLNLRK